jgi:hypothetical protein
MAIPQNSFGKKISANYRQQDESDARSFLGFRAPSQDYTSQDYNNTPSNLKQNPASIFSDRTPSNSQTNLQNTNPQNNSQSGFQNRFQNGSAANSQSNPQVNSQPKSAVRIQAKKSSANAQPAGSSNSYYDIGVPNPYNNFSLAFQNMPREIQFSNDNEMDYVPKNYEKNLKNETDRNFNFDNTFSKNSPTKTKSYSQPSDFYEGYEEDYGGFQQNYETQSYENDYDYQDYPQNRQLQNYQNKPKPKNAKNQLVLWQNQDPSDDYKHSYQNYQSPYQRKSNKKLYIVAFTMLFISATIFTFTFNSYQQRQNRSAVAGVNENSQSSSKSSSSASSIKKGIPILDEEGYAKWIKEKNKTFVDYNEDLDADGLTNGEEFLLETDPLKAKTCDDKTDVENLVNLVDPSNCKPMDLSKDENVKKFSKFINIPIVKEEFLTDIKEKDATIEVDKKKSVLQVFEIASFTDLDKLNPENIKQTTKLSETKLTYLEMVDKIQKYIQIYRSQDAVDRNYAPPVHPAVYLDVALKYDVPLKYMLALARSESRFGTDRFDSAGNLTRPGQFKNIYSIGLDDSGNNLGFATWEEGVEGFGKWYQKFQKRGVSDCSKWRIYNPNGDYCVKIETLAKEIQIFLDKK